MKISQPGHWGRPAIALVLLAALVSFTGRLGAQQGGGVPLNPSHPDTYVVKRGDTLWDIAAMFLREPWYWPEIWYVNPQIENPHWIFPGDVLTLVYVDGKPQLRMQRGQAAAGTDKLSPRIREEQLGDAVTAIPLSAIAPFLKRGTVLEKGEIGKLPYILELRDGHLVAAQGNDAYVRGETLGGPDTPYSVVRVGNQLVDPDNGDVLGYAGIFIGQGTIWRGGDPSTLRLQETAREAARGDRLIAPDVSFPLQFYPRPPGQPVDGEIMFVEDHGSQVGQYQVVVINRGTQHGLEAGSVLSIWSPGDRVWDDFNSRFTDRKVQLPDERVGTLMVFRTFDRLSYALVMEATAPIHRADRVRNPG